MFHTCKSPHGSFSEKNITSLDVRKPSSWESATEKCEKPRVKHRKLFLSKGWQKLSLGLFHRTTITRIRVCVEMSREARHWRSWTHPSSGQSVRFIYFPTIFHLDFPHFSFLFRFHPRWKTPSFFSWAILGKASVLLERVSFLLSKKKERGTKLLLAFIVVVVRSTNICLWITRTANGRV